MLRAQAVLHAACMQDGMQDTTECGLDPWPPAAFMQDGMHATAEC
jgi:hypothetical protein